MHNWWNNFCWCSRSAYLSIHAMRSTQLPRQQSSGLYDVNVIIIVSMVAFSDTGWVFSMNTKICYFSEREISFYVGKKRSRNCIIFRAGGRMEILKQCKSVARYVAWIDYNCHCKFWYFQQRQIMHKSLMRFHKTHLKRNSCTEAVYYFISIEYSEAKSIWNTDH